GLGARPGGMGAGSAPRGAIFGPRLGVLQKPLDRLVLARRKTAEPLGGLRHIPPGRQRQQANSLGGQACLDLRTEAALEDDKLVVDLAAGLADRAHKIEL